MTTTTSPTDTPSFSDRMHQHLTDLPRDGRRMVAFLGGTIGNFTPDQRRKFLMDLDTSMKVVITP